MTFPIVKSVVPETSAPLRSATPSGNRWWPANISSSSSEVAGRLSFRVWSPGFQSRVHTRRLLALPMIFLRKVAQGHRFLVSAGRSAARDRLAARNGLSPGRCPEASVAPFEGLEGQERFALRKPSMSYQCLGPGRPCPLNSGVPSVVQLQQTRTGRPTQPLQRTPEAFSTVVACEGRRLRGTVVAFKRRTLNGNTLAVLNFFVLVVVAGRLSRE